MNPRIRLLAPALLLAFCTASCVVPFPHTRIHAPARKGRVVADDGHTPVAGAVVTSLENGKQCTTDADGRFSLPAVKGWHGAWLFSPPLTYSIWPFRDMDGQAHRIRIESDGFSTCDETLGGTVREVRYRSFGCLHPSGRLWCPVETQRVDISWSEWVPHGTFLEERWEAYDHPGWEVRPLDAEKTIRLLRAEPAPEPVALCFDLEDESPDAPGKAPPPDGRPPKARVLWLGRDAPMAVLFGECAPAPGEPSWREIAPLWLGNAHSGRVVVTLDAEGRPARFELRLPWPNVVTRRDAIATGAATFRITGWETFGLPPPTPDLWPNLRHLDPRLEIR